MSLLSKNMMRCSTPGGRQSCRLTVKSPPEFHHQRYMHKSYATSIRRSGHIKNVPRWQRRWPWHVPVPRAKMYFPPTEAQSTSRMTGCNTPPLPEILQIIDAVVPRKGRHCRAWATCARDRERNGRAYASSYPKDHTGGIPCKEYG